MKPLEGAFLAFINAGQMSEAGGAADGSLVRKHGAGTFVARALFLFGIAHGLVRIVQMLKTRVCCN